MNNIQNYDGLQFNEIKNIISKYCSFSLGKELIISLAPTNNKLELTRRLKNAAEALRMTISYGPMPFGGVHDISNAVNLALKDGILNSSELLDIASQAYSIGNIKKYLNEAKCEKENIDELVSSLVSFDATANEINRCISFNGEINSNASSSLAAIRKNITSLSSKIAKKMSEFVDKNRNYLQDDIIVKRNDRNVVLIKNTYKNTIQGFQYGSSQSGNATYIEPAEIIPFNNELQQLYLDETQEIKRILFNLSQLVKKDGYSYLANNETLGLLDSLFALARYGKENNGIVGQIGDKDLIIEKARHPLIDSSKVVANSYHIIDPVKTILITGPNTGGKTVSLKIIGLFSLMFLSGMPVLADKAVFPIFDNIFYDIGDNQSINDDLSTFSAHIKKISQICNEATRNSLVIFDELGSSTDPNDGQAIASAVLEYLRQKQVYVVATTHFAKLKSYAKENDNIMISSVEFDSINLKPTYRYIENTIGQSNAIEIAKRYNLKQSIVDSALAFKKKQMSDSDFLLEKLQSEIEIVRQDKERVEQQLALLAEREKQLSFKEEKFKEEMADIIANAHSQANEIVDRAISESEEIIEELKKQNSYNINEIAKLKHSLNNIVDNDKDEELDGDLSIGDYVRIELTNQKGQIVELNKKNAYIDCNGLKVKASLGSLVKIAKPIEKEKVKTKARTITKSSFSTELNLLGYHVDEALEELDRYLDAALLNNVPYVRIIHGYGTGALRTAIWNKLKKYKFVKRFEYASNAEGSSGATIVILKD